MYSVWSFACLGDHEVGDFVAASKDIAQVLMNSNTYGHVCFFINKSDIGTVRAALHINQDHKLLEKLETVSRPKWASIITDFVHITNQWGDTYDLQLNMSFAASFTLFHVKLHGKIAGLAICGPAM